MLSVTIYSSQDKLWHSSVTQMQPESNIKADLRISQTYTSNSSQISPHRWIFTCLTIFNRCHKKGKGVKSGNQQLFYNFIFNYLNVFTSFMFVTVCTLTRWKGNIYFTYTFIKSINSASSSYPLLQSMMALIKQNGPKSNCAYFAKSIQIIQITVLFQVQILDLKGSIETQLILEVVLALEYLKTILNCLVIFCYQKQR